MKIVIVSTANLKHMTLLSLYTSYFEENDIEYDLIHADKYHIKEYSSAHKYFVYRFSYKQNCNKLVKLINFMRFKNYTIEILKSNNYDFIIVWNEITSLLFSGFLIKNFHGRYCLNIRDLFPQKFLLFTYYRLRKVIACSCFTTISSNGFRKYLPKLNYVMIHSYNRTLTKEWRPRKSLKNCNETLVITFIGNIRFYDQCFMLINELKNNSKFVMNFYGTGVEPVQKFCKENGISNVYCLGGFDPKNTGSLLEGTDIMFNLFGSKGIQEKTLTSIRFYYALKLNIPILVYNDTHMGELARQTGNGIFIKEIDNSIKDLISEQYHNIDFDEMKRQCDQYLEVVEKNNHDFIDRLDLVFNKR